MSQALRLQRNAPVRYHLYRMQKKSMSKNTKSGRMCRLSYGVSVGRMLSTTQRNASVQERKGTPSSPSQCVKLYKTVNKTLREIEDHTCGEYQCSSCQQNVLRGHRCYMQATPYKPKFNFNFNFFDFECSQDEISTCHECYAPSEKECKNCQPDKNCTFCLKCQNCKTTKCFVLCFTFPFLLLIILVI